MNLRLWLVSRAPSFGVVGRALFLGLLGLGFLAGCVSIGNGPASPAEIPSLQEKAAREPENGAIKLRLAEALAAADRCEEALQFGREGAALEPADPTGPLVIGSCMEAAGDLDGALRVYGNFLARNGNGPGTGAVEGRRTLALQARAREVARLAASFEETLPPSDPQTVGVLPFLVDGDARYRSLSVGLAHMLTTDLALLQRFSMVERAELTALLQELEISPELLDPQTAARTGRMLRASRMVLGTLSVPSGGQAQLGGNVVLETGEMAEPLTITGEVRDILDLEKSYALQIAEELGYQLSEAERQRILENRPGSIEAFLAFSQGLVEEDLGQFENAAAYYRDAVQADPGYGEAQEGLRRAVGADGMATAGPGETAFIAQSIDEALGLAPEVDLGQAMSSLASNAMMSAVFDLASSQLERATLVAGTANPILNVVPNDLISLPLMEAYILITITIRR